MKEKETAAAIALRFLNENGCSMVQSGDHWMLSRIAEQCGIKMNGPRTAVRVINAIDRTNKGEFIKSYVSYPQRGLGKIRRFTIRESFE